MKAAVVDGSPDLPGLVEMSVYDTKSVNFSLGVLQHHLMGSENTASV